LKSLLRFSEKILKKLGKLFSPAHDDTAEYVITCLMHHSSSSDTSNSSSVYQEISCHYGILGL